MTNNMDALDAIGAGLRATFPGLHVARPLRVLGEGFHSLAIETGDGLVFRVARNDEATVGQAREAALLPVLHSRVPLAIPEPRWHAGPSERFPFGVIGYRKVPGIPLDPSRLTQASLYGVASALAAFLHALHRFPIAEALAAGVYGHDNLNVRLEALCADVLPSLRLALHRDELRRVEIWWDALLADPALSLQTPVLCHGDLWYENVLVDDACRTVSGVVDFEAANVGDPAQDFAALRHLGDRATGAVIEAYRALGDRLDGTFAHRLQRYWELREFEGIRFAVVHADEDEFADSVRKLRGGALLNPTEHPPLRVIGA
jgi:aminoglycoside phosphotransferase (APT) family kinase protein